VGGIQEATPLFLAKIRELTTAYNAIFIADEVQCGYGRSGQFYAQDYSNGEADIYTMAKGMGNGFPIAGIALSSKFTPWHGMLGTTFGGSNIACAAKNSFHDEMEKENLIENGKNIGSYILNALHS